MDSKARFEGSKTGAARDASRDPDFYRDVVDRPAYLKVLDYLKANTKTVVLIVLAFLVGVSVLYTLYAAGAETRVRTRFAAEVSKTEVTFDTMFKIIKDQFNLTDNATDAFKDVYVGIANARTQDESKEMLAKFVKEQNPSADFIRLYEKVAASIEAQRTDLRTQQTAMIAVKNEDDNWLQSPVSGFFLSSLLRRKPLQMTLITSTRAKQAMQTGKDDDSLIPEKKR